MAEQLVRLGVDIGGTGIKVAPVDIRTGELTGERQRLVTPQPATPKKVADVVAEAVGHFPHEGPIGVAFPAVVKAGVAQTAANIDHSWIGTDIEKTLGSRLDRPVVAVNDADAAGVAEMHFGAGRECNGVVVLTTLGTGIGSAVFLHGQLLPNTELGHLELDGHDAETRAAESARERDDLSWEKWAKRLTAYYGRLEALLWPDLFIVGGGISKKAEKFLPLLKIRTPIVAATLQNEAGIVGAALSSVADMTIAGGPGSRRGRTDKAAKK